MLVEECGLLLPLARIVHHYLHSSLQAKGQPYQLTMSTQYQLGVDPANSYDALVNRVWEEPGAATRSGMGQFLEAAFPAPVFVSRVLLGSPCQGVFAQQGWTADYLNHLLLQYSTDRKDWKTVTDGSRQDGLALPLRVPPPNSAARRPGQPVVLSLSSPIEAQYWRLVNEAGTYGGYVATGTWIFE